MKIVKFLRDFFGDKTEIKLNEKITSECTSIAIDVFAMQVAINIISSCIAKCEFKTFLKENEVKKDEYYTWNVEPNRNQNATEFIQEFVSKLLVNNEVLIVQAGNNLIIADYFTRKEYAVNEDYFEQVTRKDFIFDKRFYMSEVLYFKYNNEDIRQYLSGLMISYDELLKLAKGKYKRAGGRKGTVELDEIAKGDDKRREKIEDLFKNKFKNYFEAENAVVDLPKGVKYTEITGEGSKKATNELGDITRLIDDALARVGQAFRIPAGLLKGDVSDVEKITNNLLTFCIDPLVNLIQTEINRKRYGKEVLNGSKVIIDTTAILHIDVFSVADKIDIRDKIKDSTLKTDWSEQHWITKNYSKIEKIDMEGGE